MISVCSNLLAFVAGGILLLPGGACTWLGGCQATPEPTSCCQHKGAAHSNETQIPRESPSPTCCCSTDGILADRAVEPKPLPDAVALIIDGGTILWDGASTLAAEVPLSGSRWGPRLHAQHCIWLC